MTWDPACYQCGVSFREGNLDDCHAECYYRPTMSGCYHRSHVEETRRLWKVAVGRGDRKEVAGVLHFSGQVVVLPSGIGLILAQTRDYL